MAGGQGGTSWACLVLIYLFVYFEHLNSSRDAPGCCWELWESGSAKVPLYKMRVSISIPADA